MIEAAYVEPTDTNLNLLVDFISSQLFNRRNKKSPLGSVCERCSTQNPNNRFVVGLRFQ